MTSRVRLFRYVLFLAVVLGCAARVAVWASGAGAPEDAVPARGSGLVILTNGINGGELWTRLVAAIGDL